MYDNFQLKWPVTCIISKIFLFYTQGPKYLHKIDFPQSVHFQFYQNLFIVRYYDKQTISL